MEILTDSKCNVFIVGVDVVAVAAAAVWCCYITVDSAMAASQNGSCSYKLSIHKNPNVPRRLFFAAQQRIAIAQSPKLHQKNQL